jgi:hypothetical protein
MKIAFEPSKMLPSVAGAAASQIAVVALSHMHC